MPRCPRHRGGNGSRRQVDSTPKAHRRLPDDALASGLRNCGCERAGGVYPDVAQDAKMEILEQSVMRHPHKMALDRLVFCVIL